MWYSHVMADTKSTQKGKYQTLKELAALGMLFFITLNIRFFHFGFEDQIAIFQ